MNKTDCIVKGRHWISPYEFCSPATLWQRRGEAVLSWLRQLWKLPSCNQKWTLLVEKTLIKIYSEKNFSWKGRMAVTWVGGGWGQICTEARTRGGFTVNRHSQGIKLSPSYIYLLIAAFSERLRITTISGYGFLKITHRNCVLKAPCFISDLYLVNILDILMFSKKGIKLKEKNSIESKLCSQNFDKDWGIFLPAHPSSIADRMNSI